MYSQQDLQSINKQLKKVVIGLIAIFLFFLIISIFIKNSVNNITGMIVMILGVCLNIFLWSMYASPIFAYYKFVKDIVTGRTREIQGLVKNISTQPLYKDNKLFYYEVIIEENGVERMLLLDDQKEWPKINKNELYNFQIHDNFITAIKI
ncbi:MAG: GIY-YIG nuclease family protein [Clostridiales bacterium]|nr:GIY-YIG nuclease family protein [Clostridiales bacterium]